MESKSGTSETTNQSKKEAKKSEQKKPAGIYEKLAKMRVELQKKKLTKTGFNSHSKYNYFELKDFLPSVNEISLANNAIFIFRPGEPEKNNASLTLYNLDIEGDNIEFTMPVSAISISGNTSMQNIGGITTYSKRYLYMDALEIAEDDSLDTSSTYEAVEKQEREKKQIEQAEKDKVAADKAKLEPITSNMVMTINSELARTGVPETAICDRYGISSISDIKVGQYKGLMKSLEMTPNKPLEQ